MFLRSGKATAPLRNGKALKRIQKKQITKKPQPTTSPMPVIVVETPKLPKFFVFKKAKQSARMSTGARAPSAFFSQQAREARIAVTARRDDTTQKPQLKTSPMPVIVVETPKLPTFFEKAKQSARMSTGARDPRSAFATKKKPTVRKSTGECKPRAPKTPIRHSTRVRKAVDRLVIKR